MIVLEREVMKTLKSNSKSLRKLFYIDVFFIRNTGHKILSIWFILIINNLKIFI